MKTLVVLNPHAAGGKAGQVWHRLEPLLWQSLGELVIAVTQHPADVAQHLDKARAAGLTRVIAIGGDGTNHTLINAIIRLNQQHPHELPMVYGCIPVGTGRDWARGTGMLFSPEVAARWIVHAQPRPTDIGHMTYDDQQAYFLNIASAGLSGEVDRRVNMARTRRPWTFIRAAVTTLLTHRAQQMQVTVDGHLWYEGRAYLAAVANGSTFGHGMRVAPTAQTNDGLFDVVLVTDIPRVRALNALRQSYTGSHLAQPGVRFTRGREVVITGQGLGLDLDGEHATGDHLRFAVQPGLLQLLS